MVRGQLDFWHKLRATLGYAAEKTRLFDYQHAVEATFIAHYLRYQSTRGEMVLTP